VTLPTLWAVSDLHVRHADNRAVVEGLRPRSAADWLIVAGDVGERVEDVAWALGLLRERFTRVLWVPGNHELWTRSKDPVPLRGEARYRHLVETCRGLDGRAARAVVAPLFLLYDYSVLAAGARTPDEGLAAAYRAGVVCTDEYLLHPDPHPSRPAWCAARVAETGRRLDALDPKLPTVLVNHWPLTPLPTRVLRHQEFSIWCGTTATADWHVRYRAAAVVYGHLHIPRVTFEDGVRFVEASLGYPREWRAREERFGTPVSALLPRQVLPAPGGRPARGGPAAVRT